MIVICKSKSQAQLKAESNPSAYGLELEPREILP